jgi:hypothetical protein
LQPGDLDLKRSSRRSGAVIPFVASQQPAALPKQQRGV